MINKKLNGMTEDHLAQINCGDSKRKSGKYFTQKESLAEKTKA